MPVRTLVVQVLEGPDAGTVAEADDETLTIGTSPGNVLRLVDETVSRYHLELTRSDQGILLRDLESTNGTYAGEIRVALGVLPATTVLRVGRSVVRVDDGRGAVVEVHEGDRMGSLFGRSGVMSRIMAQVARVARTNVDVLLAGESGTGKELLARALHDQSDRAGRPFVTVDCAALTPTLVASALFGHERGAFTGADRQHIGAFERAHGGTVFLDEIGELPMELQPQLLGVLERRRFHRLGANAETSIDVRVVCATHRDLRAEVNRGTFREDLYYRIAVVVVRSPALRERLEDLPLLVEHFLREAGFAGSVSELVDAATLADIARYRWPGNVRELRNWVEATWALGEAQRIGVVAGGDLSASNQPAAQADLQSLTYSAARDRVIAEFERQYLPALLAAAKDNVSQAARKANMDRSYLIKLLQKHKLR